MTFLQTPVHEGGGWPAKVCERSTISPGAWCVALLSQTFDFFFRKRFHPAFEKANKVSIQTQQRQLSKTKGLLKQLHIDRPTLYHGTKRRNTKSSRHLCSIASLHGRIHGAPSFSELFVWMKKIRERRGWNGNANIRVPNYYLSE